MARARARSRPARARVREAAQAQIGKPYDFFNFDLNDDRGFYCSKLVSMPVANGKLPPTTTPIRAGALRFPPWFSPKHLIGAKRVEVLHKPGEY